MKSIEDHIAHDKEIIADPIAVLLLEDMQKKNCMN